MSRPTLYTDRLAEQIYRRILAGESLRVISTHDDMPSLATIYNWRKRDREFAKNCALAQKVFEQYQYDISLIRWY